MNIKRADGGNVEVNIKDGVACLKLTPGVPVTEAQLRVATERAIHAFFGDPPKAPQPVTEPPAVIMTREQLHKLLNTRMETLRRIPARVRNPLMQHIAASKNGGHGEDWQRALGRVLLGEVVSMDKEERLKAHQYGLKREAAFVKALVELGFPPNYLETEPKARLCGWVHP